jgi:hypothetical protein
MRDNGKETLQFYKIWKVVEIQRLNNRNLTDVECKTEVMPVITG